MWWILLDRLGGRGNEPNAVIGHNAVTLFPDVDGSCTNNLLQRNFNRIDELNENLQLPGR